MFFRPLTSWIHFPFVAPLLKKIFGFDIIIETSQIFSAMHLFLILADVKYSGKGVLCLQKNSSFYVSYIVFVSTYLGVHFFYQMQLPNLGR